MKPRVLFVGDAGIFPQVFGPAEHAILAGRVNFVGPPFTAADLDHGPTEFPGVEIMISSWSPPVLDERLLERFPDLKAIFHAAGTVKPFVTDAVWRRRIRVSSAARVNAIPVAEFAVAQIVFCLKHAWQRVFEVRAGIAFRREDEDTGGVYGATVGLLSLGHSGRLVAERLRAFDVSVVAFDPHVRPELAEELGVKLLELDEVFARSDVVSCHTPLLAATAGMLRGRHFSRMKRGAAFINTARGAVVNETELIAVLARRPDLLAVLDVTSPEPPAPDSPLRSLPNVVLTPHIAGSIGREYRRIGRMITSEIERYLGGQTLLGEVTPEQIPLIA